MFWFISSSPVSSANAAMPPVKINAIKPAARIINNIKRFFIPYL